MKKPFLPAITITATALFAGGLSLFPSAIAAPQKTSNQHTSSQHSDQRSSSPLSRKLASALYSHQYQETIALCDQALRWQPNNFDAYLYRCEAELITDQRKKAIADAGRASKLNPSYIKPYVIQSQSLLLADTHEQGIADCTKLSEKEPFAPAPYLYRALFYLLTDKSKEAIVDLDRALALKPPIGLRAWIHGAKFSAYKSLNEKREAMHSFREAEAGLNKQMELYPEDLSILYIRGVITHFADKPTSDFEKTIAGKPGPVVEYLSRHVVAAQQIEQKHYAEAERLLEKNIALWPRHPSAYGLLAGCQTSNGRPDKAAATLARITLLNPVLAGTYVTRMGYYQKIGKMPTFTFSAPQAIPPAKSPKGTSKSAQGNSESH